MDTSILESFKQKAINAHNWTSFSPERRGEQLIKDYSDQLSSDIQELKNEGISEETINDYKTRYESLFSRWLSAKSNCASTMITGASNFPVRRQQKAHRSEENHYSVFQEWRIRAKKAICRKAKPEKTFISEIERYKAELESMKANHELMKQANKKIAHANKTGEDLTEYLTTVCGVAPHMIEWSMKWGFGLANNSANMRRVESRIKEMEAKNERANTTGQKEIQFDGFVVIYNHEADRLQVKHDIKPPQEVIYQFKSKGFRWSPSFGVWQRNLNVNSVWVAERLLKVTLPSIKNS